MQPDTLANRMHGTLDTGLSGVTPTPRDQDLHDMESFHRAADALLSRHTATVAEHVSRGTLVTPGTPIFPKLEFAMDYARRKGSGQCLVFVWDVASVAVMEHKEKKVKVSKRFSVCANYDHIFSLSSVMPPQMRHFYEYIVDATTPVCFFVDVDRKLSGGTSAGASSLTDDALAQEFVKHIRIAFCKKLGKRKGIVLDEHVHLLTSSNATKQSLHIIIRAPHLVFPWSVARAFGTWLFTQQWPKGIVLGGDTSVYSTKQQLRMPGSTKLGVEPTRQSDGRTGAQLLAPRPCVPTAYNGCPVKEDLRAYTVAWFDSPPSVAHMPAFDLAVEKAARARTAGAGAVPRQHFGASKRVEDFGHLLHAAHIFTAVRIMKALHRDATPFTGVNVAGGAPLFVVIEFHKCNSPCAISGKVHHRNRANIHVRGPKESLLAANGAVSFVYHCFHNHHADGQEASVPILWDRKTGTGTLKQVRAAKRTASDSTASHHPPCKLLRSMAAV